MKANMYYSQDGIEHPATNFHSEITFSTLRGLKQAIRNKMKRDERMLYMWYGNKPVTVEVYTKDIPGFSLADGKPIATTTIKPVF